jgi:hypothetical protein
MSSLDKQGEACRKLQAEFIAEGKMYNERRKEQKDALRKVLTPVWVALKSGATVNGQKGLERWAAWFNPVAKYPLRQLQRVMGEKSETTSRRVAPVDLEKLVGKVGKYHGNLYTITGIGVGANTEDESSIELTVEPHTDEEPKKEDPVVTPTPTITTKVQQGAKHKTHLATVNSIFPKESSTHCGKSVGKYGVPKTSVVTDNPTCKTCQSKKKKDDERKAQNERALRDAADGMHPEDAAEILQRNGLSPVAPTVDPVVPQLQQGTTKKEKKTHVERRQKEMEEATARCHHNRGESVEGDVEDDCLVCFPVDDQPQTDQHAAAKALAAAVNGAVCDKNE